MYLSPKETTKITKTKSIANKPIKENRSIKNNHIRRRQNKIDETNSKIIDLNVTISIIILNINGINNLF